jgi:hypothetical protein
MVTLDTGSSEDEPAASKEKPPDGTGKIGAVSPPGNV